MPEEPVDSDKLAGTLRADGHTQADAPEAADLVIVNTCAFIEAARQESIEAMLALSELRQPDARLVVTGCLAERYGDELGAALPEVDLVAGFGVPVTMTARRPDPVVRPAQPAAPGGRGPLGVRQSRRRVRSQVRVLRHPLFSGSSALPLARRHPLRGGGA